MDVLNKVEGDVIRDNRIMFILGMRIYEFSYYSSASLYFALCAGKQETQVDANLFNDILLILAVSQILFNKRVNSFESDVRFTL